MTHLLSTRKRRFLLLGGIITLLIVSFGLTLGWDYASARPPLKPLQQPSNLHPSFPLLDVDGENVLESSNPISTLNTCGSCHNTDFISNHSFHTDVGLDDFSAPGSFTDSRPWDTSPGLFGKWDPLTYRYLSPQGDEIVDLTTAGWLQELGVRHVGSGPATMGRDGEPLEEIEPQATNVEASLVDPVGDELLSWDWAESGVVEMNCFLCHTPAPNAEARSKALHSGDFGWANTATLLGTGIVEQTGEGFSYNSQAFAGNGELLDEFVNIQDPANENCGLCHGLVHDDLDEPLVAGGCVPERMRTVTTGQIISGQKLSDSGMNLADKPELDRAWDIHAERLVECTDCHFALNNPVYYQEDPDSRPEHLLFDPRRLEINEYLEQPLHQFARGQSAQSTIDPALKDTMRRCESCHSPAVTHDWLPYKERHMDSISCESCHIPQLYSNALAQLDYTVLDADAAPAKVCRGIEGDPMSLNSIITGYEPVLMPREDVDGDVKLAPYNLVSSWYWIYGDPARPVRLQDLQAAYFDGDVYHAEVVATFDANDDGEIDQNELVIDNVEKEKLIAARLTALGLDNPRINAEIQPYSINHNVTHGEWVTQDCETCHSDNSRIYQPFKLASYLPGEVMPEFVPSSNIVQTGELVLDEESGELYYAPLAQEDDFYVLGRDRVNWIDLFGSLIFLGTILAITAHAGLRLLAALRHPHGSVETEKVYMYTVYERLWHWLQTFVILGLILTGLIIHRPDTFGIFSFRYVVQVHNILAAILVINAALSLFYHIASGEIKQYIPRPRGFFDQAFQQAIYYVKGIFSSAEHPFEKTPEKKLNPLQQVTYFAILNVLLPLEIITGILMWGAQRWPNISTSIGGLTYLGPFHTLIAWLFASFIVAHVYLTTTGPTPFASIKAMMVGWDDVEITHSHEPEITGPAEEEPVP